MAFIIGHLYIQEPEPAPAPEIWISKKKYEENGSHLALNKSFEPFLEILT